MPNMAKLNDIVLKALQSRGYSYTEAKYFIKQLTIDRKKVIYHEYDNKRRIDIFV